MGEAIRTAVKAPETKKENKFSQAQKGNLYHLLSSHVEQILFLQRTIGNQAVQKLMKSEALQAKFRIGAPGDVYEKEADRVADAVMRMPEPEVQRQEEEEEMLQAKSSEDATSEVTNDLESQINAIRSGGRPLAESERAYFEPRFGHNFNQVHVHSDTQAANVARSINAQAFTLGQNVVFGSGQYIPTLNEGKRLLSHELTHVVQQRNDRIAESIQRLVHDDVTKQSITPTWAHALTDLELSDQISLLLEQLNVLGAADPVRATLLGNYEVLEQEAYARQVPTGPTADRFLNEWLDLNPGQHLSSDRAWIGSQWPVGGSLATLNATFRAGVQALLNFAAATPNFQFHIISYARPAPKQHVMHVGQYIRKGWTGYPRYKLSKWPGVMASGGRTAMLALPTHERRSLLRGITNPDVLDIVWDTGTSTTSKSHGTKVAEMYHIGINNPVANSGAAYVWPTGKTTTSKHGSGDAVDADPVQLPNVVTIRQNQAHTWPALAALQGEMDAASVLVVAATANLPAGYTITGLSNVGRRDALLQLFFQIRSAARAGFVDLAHFQAP